MRVSVKVKTLIKVVAAMLLAFVCFGSGYLKSQLDSSRYSDKYTVTVERTPDPEELAEAQALLEAAGSVLMVDINTASAQELEGLDGIGPALAERVISYREENGDFEYTFEIMNVPGIGESTFSKIKENIYVSEN